MYSGRRHSGRSSGRWGRHSRGREQGLSLEQLMRASEVKVFTCEHEQKGVEPVCVLCGEDFEVNKEIVREMECGCVYHNQCIDKWFTRNTFCPICKKNHLPTLPRAVSNQSVESLANSATSSVSTLHPTALQFSRGSELPTWSPDFDEFFLQQSRGVSPAFSEDSDYGSLGEVLRSVELPTVSENDHNSNEEYDAQHEKFKIHHESDEDVPPAPPPPVPLPPLDTHRGKPSRRYSLQNKSSLPRFATPPTSGYTTPTVTPQPRYSQKNLRPTSVSVVQRQRESTNFSPSWNTPQHARGPHDMCRHQPSPPPLVIKASRDTNMTGVSLPNLPYTPGHEYCMYSNPQFQIPRETSEVSESESSEPDDGKGKMHISELMEDDVSSQGQDDQGSPVQFRKIRNRRLPNVVPTDPHLEHAMYNHCQQQIDPPEHYLCSLMEPHDLTNNRFPRCSPSQRASSGSPVTPRTYHRSIRPEESKLPTRSPPSPKSDPEPIHTPERRAPSPSPCLLDTPIPPQGGFKRSPSAEAPQFCLLDSRGHGAVKVDLLDSRGHGPLMQEYQKSIEFKQKMSSRSNVSSSSSAGKPPQPPRKELEHTTSDSSCSNMIARRKKKKRDFQKLPPIPTVAGISPDLRPNEKLTITKHGLPPIQLQRCVSPVCLSAQPQPQQQPSVRSSSSKQPTQSSKQPLQSHLKKKHHTFAPEPQKLTPRAPPPLIPPRSSFSSFEPQINEKAHQYRVPDSDHDLTSSCMSQIDSSFHEDELPVTPISNARLPKSNVGKGRALCTPHQTKRFVATPQGVYRHH